MSTKKIFITGASGFIGSHVLQACLDKGYLVRALVLPNDPEIQSLKDKNVEVFLGDIRNFEEVQHAMGDKIDIVFHCAAMVTDWGKKEIFEQVMIQGTENVCKAASKIGVSRFVKISTNDVFGLDESKILDETSPLTKWNEPYSDTKIAAEEVAWKYFREENLPVTMVYPCWVYGPGDKTFVPLLADAILKEEMLFMRRNAIVWPTYVENLVDLLMLIATHENAVGNGYLVHDGTSTTLEIFTNHVAKSIGGKEVKKRIPYALAYFVAFVLEFVWKLLGKKERPLLTTYTVKNLGSRLRFSIDKAKCELNWTPNISHQEGLERTMQWLKTMNIHHLKQK
jgi:nucleoside-diphosphate-sugar epimerase